MYLQEIEYDLTLRNGFVKFDFVFIRVSVY